MTEIRLTQTWLASLVVVHPERNDEYLGFPSVLNYIVIRFHKLVRHANVMSLPKKTSEASLCANLRATRLKQANVMFEVESSTSFRKKVKRVPTTGPIRL